jgi:hypothetical protein
LGFIFELGRPVAEMYTPICEEAVDIPAVDIPPQVQHQQFGKARI